ncbi:3-phytase A [Plectosphaerella cucumerina]|uniref:Phytase A n=1 Tax=Plectosphaerella cucumerina TaxID=40658 RepID=A0A8K0TRS8_9PEZI|nr:3-phytase A [Plectosphaerella cucumerina]
MAFTTLSDVKDGLRSMVPGRHHKYAALPIHGQTDARELEGGEKTQEPRICSKTTRRCLQTAAVMVLLFLAVHVSVIYRYIQGSSVSGRPDISRLWGQYSPFFSAPSDIDPSIPDQCEITFAQVLSRHGSRDPTSGKAEAYLELVGGIQDVVQDYGPGYEFIRDFEFTLGKDQLTEYGEHEMFASGAAFYKRYRALAESNTPFVRASGQNRVIVSGYNWTDGFYTEKLADGREAPDNYVDNVVVVPEQYGQNNTLSHGQCPAFEKGPYAHNGDAAKLTWQHVFMPPIAERVNRNLPGADISEHKIIYFMDLCPFNTVADPDLRLSPFCNLFTADEWDSYDYYQSVAKYWGFNNGNPLASSQGVGFVNELIARLTRTPVRDATSSNTTLDSNPATFPLDRAMYADFSHDNDMMTIYAALGLYNNTAPLSLSEKQSAKELGGFSAAWTISFGARMYVEKMRCGSEPEELVRILINDRVVPLVGCDADSLGRCRLSAFIDSLDFAQAGGHWDECFA